MVEGFNEHRITQSAALVSHFGFLSVFPLMLVATTALGFVLQNHQALRIRIINSAWQRIPIIGSELARNPAQLTGSTVVLIVGLLTTVWAGTKAFMAMQTALDDIADVPRDERANIAIGRLRALIGIGLIGTAQVATVGATALVGIADLGLISNAALVVAAAVANTLVLLGTYRWLCHVRRPWRRLLPGAVFGGVLYAVLQLLGTTVVSRAISRASPVYGTFAAVIALLSWLTLHALIALIGAQLNEVLAGDNRYRVGVSSADGIGGSPPPSTD